VLRFITVDKLSIPQFRVFFRNVVQNINFSFRSYRIRDANDVETHFLAVIVSSSLYTTIYTRSSDVIRRIGGRDHFWSRDKDSGQTVRSAIAENPLLYANCTALSFIEPHLLPTAHIRRVFITQNYLKQKLDRMTPRSCSVLSTICMYMYQILMRVNMLIVCSVNPQPGRLEIVTRRGTSIAAGYPQTADESNTAYVFKYSLTCN